MKQTIGNLSGQQLEWVLCLAQNKEPSITALHGVAYQEPDGTYVKAEFTSDAQAGVIAGKYWIGVERPKQGQKVPSWSAITDDRTPPKPHRWSGPVRAYGATFGEAVGRALAISILGSAVELPEELSNV